MTDIFNTTIVCDACDKKTQKSVIEREGSSIRTWSCPGCNRKWYHPSDMQEYDNFKKIKNKIYQVKLRMVGNSYTISIPREIIDFESEMQREINDIIKLCLEEPRKLSIFFEKKKERFIKEMHERFMEEK
ncbi:MAG: hypothetical protein AABY07_09885 [Nanoarchaeota archaeon]